MRVVLTSTDAAVGAALALAGRSDGGGGPGGDRGGEAGGDSGGVTVILLDDAVTAARPGHEAATALRRALEAGVAIAASEDALARRGGAAVLLDGVKRLSMVEIADLIAVAHWAVWR